MAEIEWSAFPSGSVMKTGDQTVGLRAGLNVRFDFPGTGIQDSSGNYLVQWATAGATAVNYPALINSTTSNPVVLTTGGSDPSVGLLLITKGSGNILLSPGAAGNIQCSKQLLLATSSPSTALEAASKGYVDSVTPSYPIALSQGGTNANLTASNGGIFYSTATAGAILAGTATASQVLLSGNLSAPTWSTATYPTTTTINQLLYSSAGNVISGLASANNGVLITSVAGVPSISSTLPAAVQANITSLGTITSGTWNGTVIAGQYGGTGVNNTGKTITLGGSLTTSGAFASTFTMTNTTSVTFPTSGTLATTSQIPSFPLSLANGGTNAALTASNGGIFYSTATAGAILSGTATANQVLLSGSSTTPAWSTATYPSTTTVSQLLYSSSSNVIAGLATVNSASLVTNSAGVPAWSTTMTNGQVIVGSTGSTPAPATLTAGSGISITNAANSITIASTGSGIGWNIVSSSSQQIANNQGYIVNNATLVTFTLPVTAAVGDVFAIQGTGAGNWKVVYNTGQYMLIGNTASTPTTGSVAASLSTDCAFFVCVQANTKWELMSGFFGYVLIDNTTALNAVENALNGITGTGAFVGATSPTISAPSINQINGSNGKIVGFVSPAMSVNYATLSSASSGNYVTLGADGTDTDISISYQPKGAGVHNLISTGNSPFYIQSGTGYQRVSKFTFGNTSATNEYTFPNASGTVLITGQAISTVPSIAFSSTSGVIGTTTNDSAAAGSVGEVVSSTIVFGSAVSLTSAVANNLTSISLTAGDWDVWGSTNFAASVAFNYVVAGTSVSSAALPEGSQCAQLNLVGPTSIGLAVPTTVYKLTTTTTVYMDVIASFSSGTGVVFGTLFARRRR